MKPTIDAMWQEIEELLVDYRNAQLSILAEYNSCAEGCSRQEVADSIHERRKKLMGLLDAMHKELSS